MTKAVKIDEWEDWVYVWYPFDEDLYVYLKTGEWDGLFLGGRRIEIETKNVKRVGDWILTVCRKKS